MLEVMGSLRFDVAAPITPQVAARGQAQLRNPGEHVAALRLEEIAVARMGQGRPTWPDRRRAAPARLPNQGAE